MHEKNPQTSSTCGVKSRKVHYTKKNNASVIMGEGLGGASTCMLVATAGAILSYITIGNLASRIGWRKIIVGGIILLASMFFLDFIMTLIFKSINPIMFVNFALLGLAWAAINVNSLPMVVEMCKVSDVGKFTGYYYTVSMAAQIVTPILAGTLMRLISYKILFIYATFFTILSLLTKTQVRRGDQKVEAKKGLEAFEHVGD